MARPREYDVDPDGLLQAIHRQTIHRRLELDQQITELHKSFDRDSGNLAQQLHQERVLSDWTPYRAEALVEGPVDDGLRRAVCREVRRLEQDGYVRGDGQRLAWVQLTKQGIERVEKKQAAAE